MGSEWGTKNTHFWQTHKEPDRKLTRVTATEVEIRRLMVRFEAREPTDV